MNEKQINLLIQSLDDDLINNEMDVLMGGIAIDIDSISAKARDKLRKEQSKMKSKRNKMLAIIAASLCMVVGTSTVFASEISAFIQSLMGKTGVYGTVVDGQTYYLAEPIALDNGNRLEKAMFEKKELQIQLEMTSSGMPDVKIRVNGTEMEPRGMEGYSRLFFYDIKPTDQFDLILDGKSYPVKLTSSQSVVGESKIIETKQGDISWISMGYKKIDGGIQILATSDDPSVNFVFFNTPSKDTIKQTSDKQSSHSTREKFSPILGYDKDGNAYEFHADPNDMGRPLTKFTTDAPTGKELAIKLPGIVVTTKKSLDLKVTIPAENEKQDILQTIDLGLQKMRLEGIERVSDRTARLRFTLNTGEQANVRIWEASLDCITAESTETLWENGTCVMDVTFPEGTSELQLHIAHPTFIADGKWTLTVK